MATAKELRYKIKELMSTLTPREQIILKLRYGLDGHYPQTHEHIGEGFYLSRERVRQIKLHALRKIRFMGHKELSDYSFDNTTPEGKLMGEMFGVRSRTIGLTGEMVDEE